MTLVGSLPWPIINALAVVENGSYLPKQSHTALITEGILTLYPD